MKRQGKYFERKKPPVCDRCPKQNFVSLSKDNEEVYHRYKLFVKCGIEIELLEDDYYFFPLIAEAEESAEKIALENAIKKSIAEVF